jgi:hypothetical protein
VDDELAWDDDEAGDDEDEDGDNDDDGDDDDDDGDDDDDDGDDDDDDKDDVPASEGLRKMGVEGAADTEAETFREGAETDTGKRTPGAEEWLATDWAGTANGTRGSSFFRSLLSPFAAEAASITRELSEAPPLQAS